MKWDDHFLSFDQVAVLIPLRKAIMWLENEQINGGALHIVVEDGNYEDSNIEFCIKNIESGEYAKSNKKWGMDISPEDVAKQLEIAKALMKLSENVRGMVCEGCGLTEELFNHLYNASVIAKPELKIVMPT